MPDSAATGSAWSTGTKTYDNAVSVNLPGKPQKTLLELAKDNGLKTGDVTTSEIQDATPAVQVSHISARSCYGPDQTTATCTAEALENGGLGSITEQLLDDPPRRDARRRLRDVRADRQGRAVRRQDAHPAGRRARLPAGHRQGRARGGHRGQPDQAAARPLRPGQPAGALGRPRGHRRRSALPAGDLHRQPGPSGHPADPGRDDRRRRSSLLENPNGFFLQVEGASIDKQDHAADACGQIGETVDLDEAVQVALAYAKAKGNTSVFVTADHGHTSQIIEVGSASPGKTVTLTTADGAPMAINYGTSTGCSQQHTGTQVRIAGYGPQAANIVGPHRPDRPVLHDPRALGRSPTTPRTPVTTRRCIATPQKVKKGAQVSVAGPAVQRRPVSVVFTVKDPNGPHRRRSRASSPAVRRSSSSTIEEDRAPTTITVEGRCRPARRVSDTVQVKKKHKKRHGHGQRARARRSRQRTTG